MKQSTKNKNIKLPKTIKVSAVISFPEKLVFTSEAEFSYDPSYPKEHYIGYTKAALIRALVNQYEHTIKIRVIK
jgi:hypothetical protein